MTLRLLLEIEPVEGAEITVTGPELAYLSSVRRARLGDEVEIVSRGRASLARIVRLSAREAGLRLEQVEVRRSAPLPVELAVAVPKRNLLEDVIRAGSELGIARLWPILAERSVMEPGAGKVERWRRVAEESMRQCGRTEVLVVEPPTLLSSFLERSCSDEWLKLILHPSAQRGFPGRVPSGARLRILIGPEGGFSDREVEAAHDVGFDPVALGSTVLRIETAAMAAAVLAVAVSGSWLVNFDYNE